MALHGHEDCDTQVIYRDVDKLREVISRTDDETGSYYRFGEIMALRAHAVTALASRARTK